MIFLCRVGVFSTLLTVSAAIDFSALLTLITICKSSLRDRASNLHDAFLEEAKKCTPDSDNEVDTSFSRCKKISFKVLTKDVAENLVQVF